MTEVLWVLILDLDLFTLAGREEHVAMLTVDSTEGFLLVRILVGYIVWQETVEEYKGQSEWTDSSMSLFVNMSSGL